MNIPKALFLSLIFLSACSPVKPVSDTGITSGITEKDSLNSYSGCFFRTEGIASQDTFWVYLTVKRSEASGRLLSFPKEKDSRRGTFSGSIHQNIIKAKWFFLQEGQSDSLPVEFLFIHNRLFQKPYSVNAGTGEQYISGVSGFTLEYRPVNCDKLPLRDL